MLKHLCFSLLDMLATPMASTSSLYWQSLSQYLQTWTVNYSPYFGFSDEFLLWCFTVLSNSGCLNTEFFTPLVVVLLVAQSCPTLRDPMDCSLPGFPVHEILQSRILEWVVISSSGGSSHTRDRTQVSCIAGGFFTMWATREDIFMSP